MTDHDKINQSHFMHCFESTREDFSISIDDKSPLNTNVRHKFSVTRDRNVMYPAT
jgi:hypothetical protein